MKVLHVNTIDTGGAAIAARRLHSLLLEKGIDSKMLFLQRSGKVEIREAYYFEDLYKPVQFKCLSALNKLYNRRQTFLKPAIYFNGPESLFDISRHPLFAWADVVHLHWVVKFLDWKKVFSHKQKSFVWTCHDMNPFTGGEHYRTGYHGEFASVSKHNIQKKTAAFQGVRLKVISPSKWLADLARHSTVFGHLEISAIRNPIDDTIFKPLPVTGSDKKNMLFVAENPHDERKGFGLLLKALKNLNPDTYKLSVLGNKTFVEQSFPEAHFYGSINDENRLVEIYNAADLFVIPSLEDNLPNTVSESLLCGTPVVGMAIGGIAEMIDNAGDGYLSADAKGLSDAISRGLQHSFQREAIRKKALEKLNKDKILDDIIRLYESFNQ